jgi:hypothetical protein
MATIIINEITHRNACIDGLTEADAVAYDERIGAFIGNLRRAAEADGHTLEVERGGLAARSYRVDVDIDMSSEATMAAGQRDEEAAHEFMQRPEADFWAMY